MKTLFWVIALFALAVGLVVAARYNDGYVLVVLPPWRIEFALNLFLVLLAAGFVLLYSVSRLVFSATQMPARVREYRRARRRDKARAALIAAMEAYFEGRYAKAEQSALEAIGLGEHPRLAAVLAARAAHGLRAFDRRDRYLERAPEVTGSDDALRAVTTAELLLEQRRADEALEALKSLPRKHTAALRLELRARQQNRQWEQVAALVNELERRDVYDAEQGAKLRTHALAESLRRRTHDRHALDELWRKLPEAQKRETAIALAGAQCYIRAGEGATAQQIIEESLAAAWSSELVALYPDAPRADRVRQLERAEAWLKHHREDAALLLALGRLCAQQALWGKAQSYFEASLSIEPSWTTHFELARLHEKLGNHEASRRHFRESLELARGALTAEQPRPALSPAG